MAECPSCNHRSDSCEQCGGREGYPAGAYPQILGPCQSCIARGPAPTSAEQLAQLYSYLQCHPELVESLWEQYCGGST
jgi:hypothetical protein